MSAATSLPGGEHSTFPGRYVTVPGGGPLNVSRATPPGRGAYGAPGGVLRNPPIAYTDTTEDQLEPQIPYIVNVQADKGGRIAMCNQGDIMFGLYSGIHKSHVNQAKAMWDMNLTLRNSHQKWQKSIEHGTSVDAILDAANEDVKARKRTRFGCSVLDDSNFLTHTEGSNIYSLNRFCDTVDFLGITTDPSTNHVQMADDYHKSSLVRSFVCNAEGRTKLPNIFRATSPGQEVGLIVKKFMDPYAFNSEESMGWKQIVASTAPLEIWPVCNLGKRFPIAGRYDRGNPSFRPDQDAFSRRTMENAFQRLPDAARESFWNERDPCKIDLRYLEYFVRAFRGTNQAAMQLDTSIQGMTGLYIPLGTVRSPVGKVPSTDQIAAAVSPRSDNRNVAVNSEWVQLMSYCPIEIHAHDYGTGLYRSRISLLT
jgi:hypothetical protein